MSLHPCFRRRWLLQVCLGKAFPQKHAFVDISVLLSLRKQQPRFAQGQTKKEFHRTTKAIAEMNADGRWRRPSMLSSMCQHVARLQFDSCAERDSLSGTVMMAWIWHVWIDAMVLVPNGTSSSRGWRKRIVIQQSEFDPTSLFSPKVTVAGLPRKAFPWK